ncbi:hypothetical protein B296_00001318 [Ensete ventricosum]|uniref:Uncharacterized protein n=1 Tax=Ensete ventricosum TaxID=4639 RepID=A0A427B5F3_ENSVE|nr:hypothetical protein B296_00001318 [Ensete ventricosum]
MCIQLVEPKRLYLSVELSRLDCDVYVCDDLDEINQQPRIVGCLDNKNRGKQNLIFEGIGAAKREQRREQHRGTGKPHSTALVLGLGRRIPEATVTAIVPPLV